MAELVWDAVGDKRYETGLDRGVIFLPDGVAVPWNGLTSVSEAVSREVKPYFVDGVKYLDKQVAGAYEGTLEAYTYPDELNSVVGSSQFLPGVSLHDQPVKTVSLSYRTLIGSDLDADLGYKIHIVYNVLILPQDSASASIAKTPAARNFSWKLVATPESMFGARPTAHISFDSRFLSEERMTYVQSLVWGTVIDDPALVGMVALLDELEDLE